jgi:hypothetical protein
VTVDAARILRVPGTQNCKQDAPRPVELKGTALADYDAEDIEQALKPFVRPEPGPSPTITTSVLENAAPFPPISLDALADECPFINEAITTGGKDLANPLWNLTNLISVFTEGRRADAHRMGRDHPSYNQEETDAQFDRKVREHEEKGLGWPSCKSISEAGSKHCQTCPHFCSGKSPLHFAPKGRSEQVTAAPSDLPKGYSRRSDGVIVQLVSDKKTGTTKEIPVCSYPMTDPWLQKAPCILHFTTITERHTKQQIALPFELIAAQGMRGALQEQGLMLPVGHKATENVARFLVSWIEELQRAKAAVQSSPFGWSVNATTGQVDGFVFAGRLWSATGSGPAANPDPEIQRQYTPRGQLAPWRDAAKLVTSIERPDLDAIVAASFGAPLVRLTGQQGLQMSVYSAESGIGKTTALKVAQAVWGDPVSGLQGLSDTKNAVMNKIGAIRHLPLFWDELKTDDQVKKYVEITFEVTGGRERARMTQSVQQRKAGTWQTMLVSASNDSLSDQVANVTKTTTAGLYRIFEYEVKRGTKGQINPSDAQRVLAKLNDNFGQVGLEYAKFLGANFERLDKEVGEFLRKLGAEVTATSDERFWVALIACICMGASYANELGFTSIDEDALKKFLIGVLGDMRRNRTNQANDMRNPMHVSTLFAQFLTVMEAKHTLYTNRIHILQGKPAPESIKIASISHALKLDGLYVQVGQEDKLLRFSRTQFRWWLGQRGIPQKIFMDALAREFGMREVRGRLGAGTDFANKAAEYLLEIDLTNPSAAGFIEV